MGDRQKQMYRQTHRQTEEQKYCRYCRWKNTKALGQRSRGGDCKERAGTCIAIQLGWQRHTRVERADDVPREGNRVFPFPRGHPVSALGRWNEFAWYKSLDEKNCSTDTFWPPAVLNSVNNADSEYVKTCSICWFRRLSLIYIEPFPWL